MLLLSTIVLFNAIFFSIIRIISLCNIYVGNIREKEHYGIIKSIMVCFFWAIFYYLHTTQTSGPVWNSIYKLAEQQVRLEKMIKDNAKDNIAEYNFIWESIDTLAENAGYTIVETE